MSYDSTTCSSTLEHTENIALRKEVLDFFVSIGRLLGQPKSVAEIYGLLFISPNPLSMADLIQELQLSKGSASQGLRFLRDLGVIHSVQYGEGRREHYVAETALKQIVGGFIRGELLPHLESGAQRIEKMRQLVNAQTGDQSQFDAERIEKLAKWYRQGSQVLPLVQKFLR